MKIDTQWVGSETAQKYNKILILKMVAKILKKTKMVGNALVRVRQCSNALVRIRPCLSAWLQTNKRHRWEPEYLIISQLTFNFSTNLLVLRRVVRINNSNMGEISFSYHDVIR